MWEALEVHGFAIGLRVEGRKRKAESGERKAGLGVGGLERFFFDAKAAK